jgi:microcystin-dependent protein
MNPFVAEIRIFPFNFAPKGWAFCDGQILPLSQYTAVFSLLGTTYGGDGKSNFALPNMQGNAPMHPGQGPGLSLHDLGETGGSETVSLLESEIPSHSHAMNCDDGGRVTGQISQPANALLAKVGSTGPANAYFSGSPGALLQLNGNAIAPAGADQPHNNMQPFLTLNFCIALQGVYPPRT